MQRVDGHDGVAQVADLVEQRRESGDLVGVAVDVGAGEDDAGVLVARGRHMPGGRVAGARAPQCLAVDRDRSSRRRWRGRGSSGEPVADRRGEQV